MQRIPQRLRGRLHRQNDRSDTLARRPRHELKIWAWYDMFEAHEEVTDETCLPRTGRKPISCRWKDINKGGNEHVEVRSRLIGREIKQNGADSYFRRSSTVGARALRDQQGHQRNRKQENDDNSWYSPNEHFCTMTLWPRRM